MTSVDLRSQWARISTWCAVHAPASLPDPTAEGVVEIPDWPTHLQEWFALTRGFGEVLPGYRILGIHESIEVWESFQELMSEQYEASYFDPEARSVTLGESEPAGREAMMFLPSFIPIGGADPYYLFVDIRTGEQSGCVTGWDHTAADQHGPIWASLAEMCDAVATALETSTECNGYRPAVHQGRLGWF